VLSMMPLVYASRDIDATLELLAKRKMPQMRTLSFVVSLARHTVGSGKPQRIKSVKALIPACEYPTPRAAMFGTHLDAIFLKNQGVELTGFPHWNSSKKK
jgi:hypothetical protein